MGEPAHEPLSYSDYLTLERQTGIRHEYVDGVAVAMSGGSRRHSRLKVEITRLVSTALLGTDCETYDSDWKIRVLGTDFASYPDLSVVCGTVDLYIADRNAMTNPVLLIEVLSPSTEGWDRGEKFKRYRMIPSLQDYVLVSPSAPGIDHYRRTDVGVWELRSYGPGDLFVLEHPVISIDLDALYSLLPAVDPE